MIKNAKRGIILLLVLINILLIAAIFVITRGEDQPVYDSSSVFERIQNIQELSLVQYNYTGVVGFQDNKTLADIDIPFTQKFFLVKFDGLIKSGINLQEIELDINSETNSAVITLPEAEIMQNSIDERSLIVYDQSMNILNPIKIEDYNNAIAQEKDDMEKKAIENGILEQSKTQAEMLLTSLLTEIGFENITIQ